MTVHELRNKLDLMIANGHAADTVAIRYTDSEMGVQFDDIQFVDEGIKHVAESVQKKVIIW